ncbi:MAG: sigma-70 family RNA polymerase sigma factor [Magnetospiraceae bacterium]
MGHAQAISVRQRPRTGTVIAMSEMGKRLAGTLAAPEANMLMVAVATKRDKEAFAALFRHYAPRVKSYMRRLGAEENAADELAQEAMLSVWRKADRFDPSKASAGTWIFRVARNLRIDALRRAKHPEGNDDALREIVDDTPLADDSLAARQRDQRVKRAIDALPDPQAEVVRLSFYDGKPHSAIAEELNVPLGTVKSRLRLAFGRLRQAMGDDEDGNTQ